MVDDDYNDVEKWDEWKTVPAQYIPSAGKEAREAMGQQATLPASFVMQYTPMLDDVLVIGPADYRLRFPPTDDGRVFDIKSAVEIGLREGIEIVALASAAGPTWVSRRRCGRGSRRCRRGSRRRRVCIGQGAGRG